MKMCTKSLGSEVISVWVRTKLGYLRQTLNTILLYHCLHHLWFSIGHLRRQLYSKNKSQEAMSSWSNVPFLKRQKSLIIALFWYKRLRFFSRAAGTVTSNAGNGEININQLMIFVLCTQKQLFYERNITYAHNKIHKQMPPPAENCCFVSSYPRC